MQPNNQNPSQPEQPNQDQPTNGSSMGRVIQPLSSEEEIRKEEQALQTERPQNSVSQPSSSAANPVTTPGGQVKPNTFNGNSFQHSPQSPLSTPQTSRQQSGNGGKLVSIIVGLIILAAVAGSAYFFFFKGKVVTADLVRQTVQQTSYLRPKEWKALPINLGLETYSNTGSDSGAIATVTVKETISVKEYGSQSADFYDKMRSQTLSQSSVDSIKPFFQNGGKDCTSTIEFKTDPDTKQQNKTVGLTQATGTCTREDGKYTVKMRTVTGEDDGLVRYIVVAASDRDWSNNQATFQKMLDSIGEATAQAS